MRKTTFLCLVFLIISSITDAQTTRISGKVYSAGKAPLPGITVQIKGSRTSTATSEDGSFGVSVPDGGKTVLVFSSVGFETKELPAVAGSVMQVELVGEARGLSVI